MYRVAIDKSEISARKRPDQRINQPISQVNRVGGGFVAAVLCLGISACTLSNSIGSSGGVDEITTSSISKPAQVAGIRSDDAEIIKTAVAQADTSGLLAWQNPETGSKGTITAIDNFIGDNGKQCKKFQTTVDSFMGISLYNGETCELRPGFWALSWFLRQEG